MASALASTEDDGSEDMPVVVGSALIIQRSTRQLTGTPANIYTPLMAPVRSSAVGQTTSATTSSTASSTGNVNCEIIKPLPLVLKKPVMKPTNQFQPRNSRGQRSSVRPFFCCGSELSLVSLVDGLELKDSSTSDKKFSSIECSSSSEEEESAFHSSSSRKSSGSSVGHSALVNGEGRHAMMRRKKKDKHAVKKKFWSLRFRSRWNPRLRVTQPPRSVSHRCDLSHLDIATGCQGTYHATGSPGSGRRSPRTRPLSSSSQLIDLSHIQDFDRLYPVDDIDTIRMRERAQEMASGVELDPVSLSHAIRPNLGISGSMLDMLRRRGRLGSANSDSSVPSPDSPAEDYSLLMSNVVWQWQGPRGSAIMGSVDDSPRIHTQVDFIHCLVPQLVKILGCPYYWGVMDRYEAERLLDNKPEGTFLLRDSAQEDFLFSVSFRRYNRSLHARVEQWNHRFSFDAHDPAVFSAASVCELMEHYKDPCCCMFFEPMLTRPLPRNFPFSLQHICRAVICDRLVYDQIRLLPLPNSLKQFLQVYHYKQKVRVRRFDGPEVAYADTNVVV